ncbi:MAG TPA: sigma-54 dependent transcriptional regulator [Polyangiaceae bacterium]|nr:sigma-54 dependent transcriptional regulator [Polyangiaceae bacterium]
MTQPRLLLVDDEEIFVRGLSRELSKLGWQVQTADNAEAALRALRQNEFEALVLDQDLPGPSGVEVLNELGRVLARPVAVLLSGQLSVAMTVRAIQAGAGDVLEKPISASDLDVRLRRLLEARDRSTNVSVVGTNSELRKVLGETAGMRAAREQMQTAARYPELCLTIVGESGTGKEQVAEAIHSLGASRGRYLPVSLAALPDHMMEVELFGSEAKDGRERRAGLFELAGSGTLFFSELSEFPPPLHGKLIQALETRTFRRLGGEVDIPLQARVIAATRRRSATPEYAELYECLAAFTILLPALRDRVPDIELIAGHVLADVASRTAKPPLGLSDGALEVLLGHHWPGNVRELEIVLTEAAAEAASPTHLASTSLSADEIRSAIREHGMPSESDVSNENASGTFPTSGPVSEPLRSLERRMITDAWRTSGRNLSAAARSLGLPRTTLRDRLKKYGLR